MKLGDVLESIALEGYGRMEDARAIHAGGPGSGRHPGGGSKREVFDQQRSALKNNGWQFNRYSGGKEGDANQLWTHPLKGGTIRLATDAHETKAGSWSHNDSGKNLGEVRLKI